MITATIFQSNYDRYNPFLLKWTYSNRFKDINFALTLKDETKIIFVMIDALSSKKNVLKEKDNIPFVIVVNKPYFTLSLENKIDIVECIQYSNCNAVMSFEPDEYDKLNIDKKEINNIDLTGKIGFRPKLFYDDYTIANVFIDIKPEITYLVMSAIKRDLSGVAGYFFKDKLINANLILSYRDIHPIFIGLATERNVLVRTNGFNDIDDARFKFNNPNLMPIFQEDARPIITKETNEVLDSLIQESRTIMKSFYDIPFLGNISEKPSSYSLTTCMFNYIMNNAVSKR